ncbi:tail fiber protein [Cellulosimicrobium sp. TH-20]|uniref:Gp37-like protein n=1 Tax=Cellulosimicrobium sp. TH-20 TaxID=1980001 RepID=UPI00119ECDF8|nr:tail fiber protein [Cellulosimicrobium sp. TH-20]
MQVSDLIVEVRDVDLLRVAQIEPRFLDLDVTLRDSAVGEWTLRLPAEHPAVAHLRAPGAGIVVTGPDDEVVFSGPTSVPTVAADTADPLGIATVTGVTDEVILWQRLAYPNPAEADVTLQTAAYDVRSGTAAAVMRDFVLKNIGWHGAPERRIDSLSIIPTTATGPQITKSARFDVLGDLLREVATVAGLRFRLAQAGGALHFEVLPVVDRRALVRFDLVNGTLASTSVASSPATLTRAIVAGQGQGEARTFLERTTPEAQVAEVERGPWGRIERFLDQRNTDDPVELAQAGDKALTEEGAPAVAVNAVVSDDLTMRFGLDWHLGDAVTVVVEGIERHATVTAVRIIANASGVRLGATIGAPEEVNPASALGKRVEATERRVSALERTAEGGGGGSTGGGGGGFTMPPGALVLFGGASAPSGWLLCDGRAVSRSTYAALYSAVGTAYGAGDGSTTFNLPDFRGRVAAGVNGSDADFARGKTGGAKTHTLTADEMPSHTHVQNSHTHAASTGSAGAHTHNVKFHSIADNTIALGSLASGYFFLRRDHADDGSLGTNPAAMSAGAHTHTVSVTGATATNQNTGGDGAHNNLQPYATANYIIKY